MTWDQAYREALERMTGAAPSSLRYQARSKARIAKGNHPSIYPERVGYRFAFMFSKVRHDH